MSYKFLKLSDARIRYGNATQRSFRGKLHTGTYCDRLLEGCARRPCRIQSPNYPGIYPRNVSCQYKIRERNVPPGKHALIAVRQANYHYKEQVTKFDNSERVFKWVSFVIFRKRRFFKLFPVWYLSAIASLHYILSATARRFTELIPRLHWIKVKLV